MRGTAARGPASVGKDAGFSEGASPAVELATDLETCSCVGEACGRACTTWGCSGRSPSACWGRSQSGQYGGSGTKGLGSGEAPDKEVLLQFIPRYKRVSGGQLTEQVVISEAGGSRIAREESANEPLVFCQFQGGVRGTVDTN